MATKAKKKPLSKKLRSPKPTKRALPPGVKGVRVEDVWAKGKVLWKDDPDVDHFLQLVRSMKRD